MKDYYQTLGVERDADAEAIKKAYRQLATQWHPDKHQSEGEELLKAAEEKFKDISEAYAVLSDTEQKANYDLTGDPFYQGRPFGFKTYGDPFEAMFHRFGGGVREPAGPRILRGQSLQLSLDVSLAESLFGLDRQAAYSVNSPCLSCAMKGGTEFQNCAPCGGSGMVVQRGPNMLMQTTCQHCGGRGQKISKICDPCQGKGIISEDRQIMLRIPPGVKNGANLRVAEGGGKGFNGGLAGDVLFSIKVNYPDPNSFTEEERSQLLQLLSK